MIPKLEQALQISFKGWIRNMISLLKSDCSKRTGDINVQFFVENCAQIMYQQAYMPLAFSSEIEEICEKAQSQHQDHETCETVSKRLVQMYFQEDIEPVLLYVMQYSTSDFFIEVLMEEFIDLEWDLSSFESVSTLSESAAQLSSSHNLLSNLVNDQISQNTRSLAQNLKSQQQKLIVPIKSQNSKMMVDPNQ